MEDERNKNDTWNSKSVRWETRMMEEKKDDLSLRKECREMKGGLNRCLKW